MKTSPNIPRLEQPWKLDIAIGHQRGSVWQPFLLWILGVPGGIVLLLWFFVFRG